MQKKNEIINVLSLSGQFNCVLKTDEVMWNFVECRGNGGLQSMSRL